MPTRARRTVGSGWLGTGAARLGRADTPDWRCGGESEVLGGGHGQHCAPATLDQTWDQTGTSKKLGGIFGRPMSHRPEPRCAAGFERRCGLPTGPRDLDRRDGSGSSSERLFPRWSGCTDHAVSATAATAVVERHSGPRFEAMSVSVANKGPRGVSGAVRTVEVPHRSRSRVEVPSRGPESGPE